MGGRVAAGTGGKAGRETRRSRNPRQLPGGNASAEQNDPCLGRGSAGVCLGIKAGELVYDIPHPKLQKTGKPLTGQRRKHLSLAIPETATASLGDALSRGRRRQRPRSGDCPGTGLVAEPAGGAGPWRLQLRSGHPRLARGSPPLPGHRDFGRRGVGAAGAPGTERGRQDGDLLARGVVSSE